MPGQQILLVSILTVCLLLSGFLSGSETAVVAIPRERLDQIAASGARGRRLRLLVAEREATIGAILLANNFVNILAAAVATLLATSLWGEATGTIIATLGMTILVLIFGEVTPKMLAARFPEQYGLTVANPLWATKRILAPLSQSFVWSGRMILSSFGVRRDAEATVTEQDVLALAALGVAEGGINVDRSEIIESLFETADRPIREVMTPRVDVVALTAPLHESAIRKAVADFGHSRFPVVTAEGGLDEMLGVLYVKDLIRRPGTLTEEELRSLVREPHFVPESAQLLDVLRDFKNRRIGFAAVVDEHGGFEGLVSAKDLVGEVMGDMSESDDPNVPQIRAVYDDLWRADGRTPIEDVAEALEVEIPDGPYATLAGFILAEHGDMMEIGGKILFVGIEMIVTEKDRNRISQVRLRRLPADS
jgi:putative hemolysin